ncbi:baculoviral IAP repeat-containing protein 3-like [Haliotis cracherodii]|uniref:baculoviral IAP repeat-containing protein 3-like n=1 Tax=Haliotis cracherodii TaxID=6455 RepID=UPI0039E9395C
MITYAECYADCVRCFVCGVGLKTWEEGDDPWVEHVRWRSSCAYVKAIKGDVFIAQTLTGVGQKLQTERTGTNIPATGAEGVVRNAVGDVLEREACQRALEMGYSRDCVRQHALAILRNQGNDSLTLHVLVERILQEDLEISEAAAATTTQASPAGLPHTKSHSLLAPGDQHGRSAGRLQGDTYTGIPSGQQSVLGQIVSDGEDEGYGDTDEPTTFSAANKYQSLPTSLSDRNSIHRSRMPKVKAKNKAKEELEATEEETQQLRESSACKICLEDPANIVFLPCGHLVACAVCAPALERCPVCRTHIRGSVRVHLADMASVSSP